MDEKQLQHCISRLNSGVPLLGKGWRHAAAMELTASRDPKVVPHLVAALDSADADVRQIVRDALLKLEPGAQADALCATWASSRSTQAGEILRQNKLVASQPLELRTLTACWAGTVQVSTSNDVAQVAALLKDRQPEIRTAAGTALRSLQRTSLQSALCELAISQPDGQIAGLCKESGYVPTDDERACLYLFITRQLDAFFERDADFAHLYPAYEHADSTLKERIMEIVQTGDIRCRGFFGRRKPLSECKDDEIAITIRSARSYLEWDTLWGLFKELPLRLSEEIPGWLRAAGWRPTDEDESVLFDAVCQLQQAAISGASTVTAGEPSAIDRWIDSGKSGELAKLESTQLMQRLSAAPPPEGVQIVGALALKIKPGSEEARQVAQNEHWLVRLAAYAVGLWSGDASQDPNYWVRELASAASVMDLWPARRTPGLLREMQNLPTEAFSGRLGTQRRIVMELIAYSLDRAIYVRQRQEGVIFTRQ